MSRIQEIENRLKAATPGYWDCDGFADGDVVNLALFEGSNQGRVIAEGITTHGDADFLRYAPSDVAYLLAEIRKQVEE
jgi:hypothetical protein